MAPNYARFPLTNLQQMDRPKIFAKPLSMPLAGSKHASIFWASSSGCPRTFQRFIIAIMIMIMVTLTTALHDSLLNICSIATASVYATRCPTPCEIATHANPPNGIIFLLVRPPSDSDTATKESRYNRRTKKRKERDCFQVVGEYLSVTRERCSVQSPNRTNNSHLLLEKAYASVTAPA